MLNTTIQKCMDCTILAFSFLICFYKICRNLRSEITELKQGNSKHRMETANLKRDINRSVTQYMRH